MRSKEKRGLGGDEAGGRNEAVLRIRINYGAGGFGCESASTLAFAI